MEGGGEERSRPIAKRRDGVCRRVSSVPRGAPVPPPARRSSAVPAPLAAPRGRRVPLSPRVPGSVPSTPGCRASASPPPPAAASLTPASAGGQGSAGPAVSPAADLRPCILGKGVGGLGGVCPFPPIRQPPPRSLPEPLCNAVPCRPTRGERRPPPEQTLCPERGARRAQHPPPKRVGEAPPPPVGGREGLARRALRRGGRREPGQESRERSPSLGKLDESSGRGRQPPPRRSQPFPGAAGAGEHLSPLPSASTGARHGLGLRYPGRRHRGEPPTPSSHGAAAWTPSAAPSPPSSPDHTAAVIPRSRVVSCSPCPGCPPPPPPPAQGSQLGAETRGAASGTGAGQGGGGCQRRSCSSPPGQLPVFLADRSAAVSQGLLQGLRGVTGNS